MNRKDIWNCLKRIESNTTANTTATESLKTETRTRFDAIEAKTTKNDERIERLETQIAELKTKSVSSSYVNAWSEQSKLRNNISVIGLSPFAGENLQHLMTVCAFFSIKIGSADLESVYRVRNGRSNMIIAKFTNFETKVKLISSKLKKRITVGDIPSVPSYAESSKKDIYINSHLTPAIGRLLHRGRMAVKEKKFSACWVATKGIMVKLTETSEATMVTSMDELNDLAGGPLSTSSPKPLVSAKRNRKANDSFSPNNNMTPKSKHHKSVNERVMIGPLSAKRKGKKQQQPHNENKNN